MTHHLTELLRVRHRLDAQAGGGITIARRCLPPGMMRAGIRPIAIVVLLLVMATAATSEATTTDYRAQAPDRATVDQARAAARRDGEARVIVTMRTAFTPVGDLSNTERAAQRRDIADRQEGAAKLLRRGEVVHRFTTVPLLTVTATADEIGALAASDDVADVRLDRLLAPELASTTPIVGSTKVATRGVTGQGRTVAVLDTGVDASHPFLAGRVVDEACFGGCPNGQGTMTGPGAGTNCSLAIAGCNHGTHVAGIAAGAKGPNNVSFNGVAPGATVMSVNVFHRLDNVPFNLCGADPSPCARSWTSDEIKGLEYVFNRRSAFSIAAVNMSLGDGGDNTSFCTGSWFKPAIDNLRSVGIATVVSAGNEGHINGLSEPACVPSAVSVGATTDTDGVPAWSNSSSYLDLLAPGESVTSSVPGGGFATMSGTSMAAPHVTGALALLRQAYPAAGVSELVSRLVRTGARVFDAKSGRTNSRIDIDRASRFAAFPSDFSRDLRADFAVWRPSTGEWWVPGQATMVWGQPGDKPVPGDYDGDGSVEKAIWRPSTGEWWIPGIGTVQWGTAGDVPVPGDYDGDGRIDIAVWRPSTGEWYVKDKFSVNWGESGDTPVPADYDGDGRIDIAVWRPSTGEWWVRGQFTSVWGGASDVGDVPVPADYNGDGRADVAIWRPSTGDWWVSRQFTQQWGTNGDIPTPRDTNGDGVAELAIWRPSSGTWFTLRRTPPPFIGIITSSFAWGGSGDFPVGPTAQQLR